jgi:hypothetical protein
MWHRVNPFLIVGLVIVSLVWMLFATTITICELQIVTPKDASSLVGLYVGLIGFSFLLVTFVVAARADIKSYDQVNRACKQPCSQTEQEDEEDRPFYNCS